MRQRTLQTGPTAIAAMLILLLGCGGQKAADPDEEASGSAASEQSTAATPGGSGAAEPELESSEAGSAEHRAEAEDHERQELTQPLDPTLAKVAAQTASALSGADWGLVWDLSCRSLVGDQPREAYTATLAEAGTPGQLAGGTLTVGGLIDGSGVDAAELPLAAGETRWVELRQGESIIGIARFVDAGEGFRYCGLSV